MDGAFRFERVDVAVETTARVQANLKAGQGCVVLGDWGSGKSHAVRRAVNGAAWIDLDDGPLQQSRFMVDLARQVDDGRPILEAYARGHLSDALAAAEDALSSKWLVIDRGERLAHGPAQGSDEPSEAIWSSATGEIATWLLERLQAHPTVVIAGRRLADPRWQGVPRVEHRFPADQCPIKLRFAPGGYRDWEALATTVCDLPAALVLSRALVPLVEPDAYRELVDDLQWTDSRRERMHLLGERLRESMPVQWRRVLMVVDALEGLPLADVEAVLDERGQSVLSGLIHVGLVETTRGRAMVLPTARRVGLLSAADEDQIVREALERAALSLQASVNDVRTLEPRDAERIFRAHKLYVRLRVFDQAHRLARLHVAGLVELARRESLDEAFDTAYAQYSRIETMLQQHDTDGSCAGDVDGSRSSMQRLRSYVTHYKAYNGSRARLVTNDEALQAYIDAVKAWPDNALWHERVISGHIRLGQIDDARRAVEHAYGQVRVHPRRDAHLRVAPAWTAVEQHVGDFGLELIDPVIGRLEDLDPEAAARLDSLLARYRSGVKIPSLRHARGSLVFTRPVELKLRKHGQRWMATADLQPLLVQGQDDCPGAAVAALAESLVEEAGRLLRAPVYALSEHELACKRKVIGAIDLLYSDLGFKLSDHRWLLGRVEDARFVPSDGDFDALDLVDAVRAGLSEPSPPGFYLARTPVGRDGRPTGRVERLEPAGSGRSLSDLLDHVRRVAARDLDDAG